MSRYHERKHRRGAGRRRPSVVPPPVTEEPDPDPPPTPDPSTDFVPGWPFPSCTSAWNIAMSSSGRRAGFRIACPKDGTLEKIHLHLKCGSSSSAVGNGYGAGNTGQLSAWIYSPNAQGFPGTLLKTDTPFTPGWYNAAAGTLNRDNQNSVYIDADSLVVTEDQLIIVVWANTHASPGSNYFSINALHDDSGPRDAYAANNMNIDYEGATNGFDPRTCSLWSTNSGSTWGVMGNPGVGPFSGQWNPAYALEYSDGSVYGQPTYYGGSSSNTSETITLKHCGTHTFTKLASISPRTGSTATVTIKKNGVTHQAVSHNPGSAGSVARTTINPLSVTNSDVVTIECNASTLKLSNAVSDGVWDDAIFALDTDAAVYPENVDHRVSMYLEPIPTAWKLLTTS